MTAQAAGLMAFSANGSRAAAPRSGKVSHARRHAWGRFRNPSSKEHTDEAHASFLAEFHGFGPAGRHAWHGSAGSPRRCRRADQDRHPAFAVRHDGDQRNDPEERDADAGRRPECQRRSSGPADPADRGRPRLQLAAVRREGPRTAQQGSRRGGVRLLDVGVAQIGAAGVRGTERPVVLSAGIRRRGTVAERVLRQLGAGQQSHSGAEIPDEPGQRLGEAVRAGRHGLRLSAHQQQDHACVSERAGVSDDDILENYTPFAFSDWQTEVARIKKFGSAGKKTAVVSTINGDANVPFYKELGNQGIKATDIPVIAFSVGEEELAGIDTKPLVGHMAAWSYFESVPGAGQREVHRGMAGSTSKIRRR